MSVSAKTVKRRISEMADNVNRQQLVASRSTRVQFALDESIDINDIPCLYVFARYSDTEVHNEQCFLKPMYDNTKEEDILMAFTNLFENREEDIGKIFAITTDGAPVMVYQIILLSQKINRIMSSNVQSVTKVSTCFQKLKENLYPATTHTQILGYWKHAKLPKK
ncbi:uncharacterized protein [Palaemon carinicauda]|uniref:uncharacterized protein n=1 Tax=Palaemon carinicauda TaxID=392227 RepID=UPI0035B57575